MHTNKFLYWLPRVLTIAFAGFISIFSLDIFEMEGSWQEKLVGFLIHNIPTLLIVLALIFAWKNEKKGGAVFILLGALLVVFTRAYQEITTFFLICLPLLIIGVLFLLSGCRAKKSQ